MDKPTPKQRALHILEAIQLIRDFVADSSLELFLSDPKIQSAIQYQFLIIGEAIKHFDDAILSRYNYPWHIPRSFRNFIIHVYHGIKMERIYFATQDLDELEKRITEILENEFE
jgi:uncharacterized protein with HEPN domain